jgi:hypothetical protein
MTEVQAIRKQKREVWKEFCKNKKNLKSCRKSDVQMSHLGFADLGPGQSRTVTIPGHVPISTRTVPGHQIFHIFV